LAPSLINMYTKTSSAIVKAMVGDSTGFGFLVFSRGAEISLTNGTDLPLETGVSGNLPVVHLDGGENASEGTFWSGSGEWKDPLPLGSIWKFAFGAPNDKFIPADGKEVNISDYPRLSVFTDEETLTLPTLADGLFVYVG